MLDIGTFSGCANDGSDTTPAVREALAACREKGVKRLVFPEGRYDFFPDLAAESYCFISNNDEGLKRIAFPLFGLDDIEIDGLGSRFVFHGFMSPFVLNHASRVTLRGFTMDFERPFHSEGVVLAQHDEGLDLEIPEAYPYCIRNGILTFTDGRSGREVTEYPYGSLLEFDSTRRETAYQARDYWGKSGIPAKELGDRRVRMFYPGIKATPGNVMVFGAASRSHPGIFVTDCCDVRIENVAIHHCGGMGVIAQRTHNVSVVHCQITPPPGGERIVSATADATHFVNCTGRIELGHCLFENQKDDATNIHGLYMQIARVPAPNEILVQFKHRQQFGIDFIEPGTRLEVVDGDSMNTIGEVDVEAVERLNNEFTRVRLRNDAGVDLQPGQAVGALRDFPEVHIHNCVIRNNRARGILLNCRGKTLVENNHFHAPGAAILFEGDARFWFEQAGVSDCRIVNNLFDTCNFGVWGQATIDVKSGIDEACRASSRYNRNIVIENNTFRVYDDGRIVLAYSVDGLTIRGNRREKVTVDAYPPRPAPTRLLEITDCDRVVVEGNEGMEL